MPSKLIIVGRDKILQRGIQIPEGSLPSWLTEEALMRTYATMAELNRRIPFNGHGFVLSSPDGQSWAITIGNDGALSATPNV